MESFINHDDAKETVPQEVQNHLAGLIAHSRLPDTEETRRRLLEAWLLKKAAFEKTAEHGGFARARSLGRAEERGCVALTLSGSLLTLGPPADGKRELRYSSIGLRTDVPEGWTVPDAVLAADVECGRPVRFSGDDFVKTSAVIDIALAPAAGVDQAAALRRADEALSAQFVRLNRQVLEPEKEKSPDALARRDDLFNRWIIIQWFLYGGFEKHVFLARAKMLWLDLFTSVYGALSAKISPPAERDARFLDFTNGAFARFCDEYKWYESERKDFDIGLMKALEELPFYQPYIDFVDDFKRSL